MDPVSVCIFSTQLGWCGLLGSQQTIARVWIGHAAETAVREAVAAEVDAQVEYADWYPDLRIRLQDYSRGARIEFQDIHIEDDHLTEFQRAVSSCVRTIPYGQTRSYGEVAALAGTPRAARAVGNTMAANRFPLLVPCHRVLAAGGRIGGFSAPSGLVLKEHLLAMEANSH